MLGRSLVHALFSICHIVVEQVVARLR